MTIYGHDPATSAIVAVWSTGDGAVAQKVARVPPSWAPEQARQTAGALSVLSARLWLAYAEEEVDEIPLRQLPEAVRRPFLPIGSLVQHEDDGRLEAAHEIGRLVARAPGRAFREAIVRDVTAEVEAVRAADGGDLGGRAQQAVEHPRPQAQDEQIAVAHALLLDEPLGPAELHTTVEPTAAGIAALRWLRAASTVTAGVVGHAPADVIALAEAIEHEDLGVARSALAMASGNSDADVVWDLLHEAVLAGRGRLLFCPDRYGPPPVEADEHGHRLIVTVLDPREPGRSLVSGLVRGIQGCFRVYVDEISTRDGPDTDPLLVWSKRSAELWSRYCDEVRETARSLGSG
ncbi:hypothetical protein [Pseudonocardia endophytica]|uniref:Uncharacterized protein n=1 Tax=Pseudonocardia endophytica TaxID=401976 RepID=A0A4R1HH88_PSEEN|nr:hypothetical protein [Pseudonocardia endophytica]TCK21567.1 hypothetical protein EV378_5555 [Pseudonocardia endophytica]